MKKLKEVLIKIWENEIPVYFKKGVLVYERQLQAILYYHLKNYLPMEYEVWIEPIIFELNKIKPDIIITNGEKIVAVIELKFKPWEFPHFRHDIIKLNKFNELIEDKKSINLGIIPYSSVWRKQREKGVLAFNLKKDYLKCFIVFGRPGSSAFITEELDAGANFLHLHGYIENEKSVKFNHKFAQTN